MATNAAEAGRERHMIDSGMTGEKIAASDPATAPMQTDAESAGTPTPERLALASASELVEMTWRVPRPDTFGAWRQPDAAYQHRLGLRMMAWTAVAVGTGVIAGWVGLA